MGEYGLRWQEFNLADRLVAKERMFKTEGARMDFAESVVDKPRFAGFVAWLDPRKVEGEK